MTSSITVTFRTIDLQDPQSRLLVNQVLSGAAEHTFYQANGSHLATEDLLQALNAFNNENEARDLNLDELEQLSGGVGLPEALVSSTILMAMVSGACGCFANSMGAVNNSQIQDVLNAGIQANIEQVRNDLAGHNFQEATGTYNPTAKSGAIGQDFIDKSKFKDADGESSNGVVEKISLGTESVTREIKADGNGITITYSYDDDGDGNSDVIHSTMMVAPAAGWLS